MNDLMKWLSNLDPTDRIREANIALRNFALITAHTGKGPDQKILYTLRVIVA